MSLKINKKTVPAVLVSLLLVQLTFADSTLTVITITETAGLDRQNEYLEIPLQLDYLPLATEGYVAVDEDSVRTPCQTLLRSMSPDHRNGQLCLIFPVSLPAHAGKVISLKKTEPGEEPEVTDLRVCGESTELIIENTFYRADLTRSLQSEAKNHRSGQLRDLLVKMNNQLLFRTENRMHWAPNFQKEGESDYNTIAQWDDPGYNRIDQGSYLVQTVRRDRAPDYPEIMLTATYKFYADKPYFLFYSQMEMVEDVVLVLLRNDEMTMDSMFTHVACKRPDGRIENMTFAERDKILAEEPIEDNAIWICFYNDDKKYGFGSIRLLYENDNNIGEPSPLFMPHTKVSDGAGGGKYWNRRLIHEHPTFVPAGSRYIEKNAYIVFKIEQDDRFAAMEYWSQRLRNPILWKIAGIHGTN